MSDVATNNGLESLALQDSRKTAMKQLYDQIKPGPGGRKGNGGQGKNKLDMAVGATYYAIAAISIMASGQNLNSIIKQLQLLENQEQSIDQTLESAKENLPTSDNLSQESTNQIIEFKKELYNAQTALTNIANEEDMATTVIQTLAMGMTTEYKAGEKYANQFSNDIAGVQYQKTRQQ